MDSWGFVVAAGLVGFVVDPVVDHLDFVDMVRIVAVVLVDSGVVHIVAVAVVGNLDFVG